MKQNINIKEVSIIIPIKDNQKGINQLLASFFKTQQGLGYPIEIIIVDNNSKKKVLIPKQFINKGITINLISCTRPGPGSARNAGANIAKGKWLFFTDSDCLFTETTLKGYIRNDDDVVAYAGKVVPFKQNIISKYYDSINLLNPPISKKNHKTPQYIVTANCLIRKDVFLKINGFDESFIVAAGEDVDLGLRLLEHGEIYYANDAIIKHNYENNIISFYKRFYRYGVGISLLEKKYNMVIDWKLMLPKEQYRFNWFFTVILSCAVRKGLKS
ncbi:MAG: glycosyltransferase [Flavobacteriales bacterium]|nr:glycosyltransferase [Flavobacteriales bacterium]